MKKTTALIIVVAMLLTAILPMMTSCGVVSVIFMDGETEYRKVAVEGFEMPPDPVKGGYIFEGWWLEQTYSTEFDSSDATGLTEKITVYAKWQPIATQPTGLYYDASTTTMSWYTTVGTTFGIRINNGDETKLEDNSYVTELNEDDYFEVRTYTPGHEDDTLYASAWTRYEYTTVIQTAYANKSATEVMGTPDPVTSIATGLRYFTEGSVDNDDFLVTFFVGISYTLSAYDTVEVISNGNVTVTDKTLLCSDPCNFDLVLDGITYKAQAVRYVSSLAFGAQYIGSFNHQIGANSDFLVQNDNLYYIGKANAFKFELSLLDMANVAMPTSSAVLSFTVVDEDNQPVDVDNFMTVYKDGTIKINNTVEDGKYTITISLKYNSQEQSIDQLVLPVYVNNGINVNEHYGLRDAFGDNDISIINIHSSIEVVLEDYQVNAEDNTPINFVEGNIVNQMKENLEAGKPVYDHIVGAYPYVKAFTGPDQNLTINGNYFTIDAQNINLIDTKSVDEDLYAVKGQVVSLAGSAGVACNVKTSMFMVTKLPPAGETAYVDSINLFDVNNLKIVGNTENANPAPTNQVQYKKSGGMIALKVSTPNGVTGNPLQNHVIVDYDNLHVTKTTQTYFVTGQQNEMYCNDCYADDIFYNCVFSWGNQKTWLEDCLFERCGGSSICIEDYVRNYGVANAQGGTDWYQYNESTEDTLLTDGVWYDPIIYIKNCTLNNRASAESEFIQAFQFTSVATMILTSFPQLTEPFGYSVMQYLQGETGLIQAFNWMLVMQSGTSSCNSYAQADINIWYNTSEEDPDQGYWVRSYKKYDYITSSATNMDPRIQSVGDMQLLAAAYDGMSATDSYSAVYNQTVRYMTTPMAQLTPMEQYLLTANGVSAPIANQTVAQTMAYYTVIGNGFATNNSQANDQGYIQIYGSIAGFGNIIALIEYAPIGQLDEYGNAWAEIQTP